jgi:hypothetical protein
MTYVGEFNLANLTTADQSGSLVLLPTFQPISYKIITRQETLALTFNCCCIGEQSNEVEDAEPSNHEDYWHARNIVQDDEYKFGP